MFSITNLKLNRFVMAKDLMNDSYFLMTCNDSSVTSIRLDGSIRRVLLRDVER